MYCPQKDLIEDFPLQYQYNYWVMSSRYDSLDVSLQMDGREKTRLNKTIEVISQRDSQDSKPENDERVNKFKELYFKNEKLRKELKVLNEKLNQKLEKLKLPSVKKKAQSVDLNHVPPSKALQKELENAYKQIAMYKKQVETLKGKEETPENYDKLRNTENMIGYMDMEINKVQEQLKSVKNVKKMQEKVLSEDVDNVELKQRLNDYQTEIKNFKQKLKDMDRKSRKRQQDIKKQQAYLVMLETRLRKFHADQKQDEKPEVQKPKEATQEEFKQIKQQIKACKEQNEQVSKKLDTFKKIIRHTKQQKYQIDEKYREKEGLLKQLIIQVESFTRLLKDLEIKHYEQTGVRPENKEKSINKLLKLEEIEDQPENMTISEMTKNRELEFSKLSSSYPNLSGQQQFQPQQPPQQYQQPQKLSQVPKDERQWKGKMRKVSMGYMMPTDQQFQESGKMMGMRVYLDENRTICGLGTIMAVNGSKYESKPIGAPTNIELKWQVQEGDELTRILGSFSQQGYLAQVILVSRNGLNARFGNTYTDAFQFNLQAGEYFTGMFGGLRRLGQDIRITEIGFWISKL